MNNWKKMAAAAVMMAMVGISGVYVQAEETEQKTAEADVSDQVASADEMAAPEDVVEDWMVPIYGNELNDGTYEAEAASSSSMFRITDCKLTVKEGKMSAVLTLSGTGYLKLYMGTGEEAAKASEDEMIPYVENEEGAYTYEVPVEALDMGIDCAAFSKNKEKWYDRVLVFKSASLPAGALKEVKMTTAADLNLEDGTYTAEAELQGGSGRSVIESPLTVTVENGTVMAEIIFGSPYYDYVLVDGEKYEPVNTEGNSAFLIPVDGFDYNMPVTADTIAMSVPHEIDYTIVIDSSTLEAAE